MGGGSWDHKLYASSSAYRADSGIPDFDYHDKTSRRSRDEWEVHEDLDPKKIKDSVNGLRESRDSAEHPNSLAIAVLFDVTGSMSVVPQIFQKNMSKLMSTLVMRGGIEDPQVCIGAIGDATCDKVPFQVAQFESDNRVDEHLRNIFLEGGGGAHTTESYELGLYFAARLTGLDCLEKRDHKGYLIISGDEAPYPFVDRGEVKEVFGINEQLNIPLDDIFAEALEKYEIYYIMPNGTTHWREKAITNVWQKYLGQNVLYLEKPEAICELITSLIGKNEGIPEDTITTNLVNIGSSGDSISAATKALAHLEATTLKSAVVTGDLPESEAEDTTEKL